MVGGVVGRLVGWGGKVHEDSGEGGKDYSTLCSVE